MAILFWQLWSKRKLSASSLLVTLTVKVSRLDRSSIRAPSLGGLWFSGEGYKGSVIEGEMMTWLHGSWAEPTSSRCVNKSETNTSKC